MGRGQGPLEVSSSVFSLGRIRPTWWPGSDRVDARYTPRADQFKFTILPDIKEPS